MPSHTEISDADFVNSFLKACRKRGMSAAVIYGERVGLRVNMRLVSNQGSKATTDILSGMAAKYASGAGDTIPALDASEEPTPTESEPS